jgi:hypothetical protein
MVGEDDEERPGRSVVHLTLVSAREEAKWLATRTVRSNPYRDRWLRS